MRAARRAERSPLALRSRAARLRRRAWSPVVVLAAACLLLSACATPIGVNRVDHTKVYRTLNNSALSSREPSI